MDACRAHVLGALADEMRTRSEHDDWIERERAAVAAAANDWAQAHGYERRITAADVERIEGGAVGHVDYARKLALYVAEFIVDPERWQLPRRQRERNV